MKAAQRFRRQRTERVQPENDRASGGVEEEEVSSAELLMHSPGFQRTRFVPLITLKYLSTRRGQGMEER